MRIRRLFLIMLLSVLALFVRIYEAHADDEYLKAAHILEQILELESTPAPKAANESFQFAKFVHLADELEALHPTPVLRKSSMFKSIEEKMGELLERFKYTTAICESLVRGMNGADLWTRHELWFLLSKIEAGEVSYSAKSILLIAKKLEPSEQKRLRDALAKKEHLRRYALIYEMGMRDRKDMITLIRLYEGLFTQILITGVDPDPVVLLTDFPTGMQLESGDNFAHADAPETRALKHLTERYKGTDINVHAAVREAKKLGPLFSSSLSGLEKKQELSDMFYERLTKTGFDDCSSEWVN